MLRFASVTVQSTVQNSRLCIFLSYMYFGFRGLITDTSIRSKRGVLRGEAGFCTASQHLSSFRPDCPSRSHSSLSLWTTRFFFPSPVPAVSDPPPRGWHSAHVKCRTGRMAPLLLTPTFKVSQGCGSGDYSGRSSLKASAREVICLWVFRQVHQGMACYKAQHLGIDPTPQPRAIPAPGMGMKWPIKTEKPPPQPPTPKCFSALQDIWSN